MTKTKHERDAGQAMTQEEVAAELGLTRARVAFLERQALRKLRRAAETRRALREMFEGGFGL